MPRRPSTILLVEDDADLRSAFRLALTSAGFDVLEAPDGLQAIQRIGAGTADLIVLDMGLPGVDGYGVLAELAKDPRHQSIPVVVVSGESDAALDRLNVTCVARKPVSPDILVTIVRRCLA